MGAVQAILPGQPQQPEKKGRSSENPHTALRDFLLHVEVMERNQNNFNELFQRLQPQFLTSLPSFGLLPSIFFFLAYYTPNGKLPRTATLLVCPL